MEDDNLLFSISFEMEKKCIEVVARVIEVKYNEVLPNMGNCQKLKYITTSAGVRITLYGCLQWLRWLLYNVFLSVGKRMD